MINPDDFLQTEDGRFWTPERGQEAWSLAWQALEDRLARPAGIRRVVLVCGIQGSGKSTWIAGRAEVGDTLYFDAALPAARHRSKVIETARSHGAAVEAVWIHTPLDVALRRNAGRRSDRRIPESTILSVARQFEAPSRAEGFISVFIVEA